MNPYGSYRALLNNSVSAILAAVEIYNKPRISYRNECFVVLLINSWELMLKAILSKNKISIYEPKKRNQPQRTLSLWQAISTSKNYFPQKISHKAVIANINSLVDYRDNVIHFYNEKGFETVIYGLAQTSIVNFRDIVKDIFDIDIAKEVNINLLPLSFSAPPDPIKFIGEASSSPQKPAIAEFLKIISETTKTLEDENIDTGRFLTVFKVNLQSTKKIQSADIVAGVNVENPNGLILVTKKVDPNISHPNYRKDILELLRLDESKPLLSTYTFDAITWHYKIKEQDAYSWHNSKTHTYLYSNSLVEFIQGLNKHEIENCLMHYKLHVSKTRKKKTKKIKATITGY